MKFKKNSWGSFDKDHQGLFPALIFSKENWFYLFHMLIFVLLLYPYLEVAAQDKPWIFTLLNSALTVTIVYTVSFNFKQFLVALILGSIELIFLFFPFLPYSFLAANVATALLYVYTMLLILAYLVHAKDIGIGEIYGSISLYILIGMTWAVFYQLIEYFHPGSFYIDAQHNLDRALTWSDFIFFSFTTLTTLGYGDISPVSSYARSLSIIEALTGVVFIAVIVSRSIGLHLAGQAKK
ncbi:MAG: two pore domain potassium channel family protein [Chlamydiales bacterium]|nr:ion channel [Chlamydiales bacterium]NCF70212.1 two pore domain potassium channel family protein [Chlamydiales bacterium]